MEPVGFFLYLIFVISWFLHLPARMEALSSLRFDLLLVIMIFLIYLFFVKKDSKTSKNRCYKSLVFLIVIIVILTPATVWPGSAIKYGFPRFAKGLVFFFFTVWFVKDEFRLKLLVIIVIFCQSFRVLEPLCLHVFKGYWGDAAWMQSGEYMQRLSGAPSDVINPNGLAFVVLMLLCFLLMHYKYNSIWKFFVVLLSPLFVYVLYLTGSRSGMIGLFVVFLVYYLKSRRKKLLIMPVFLLCIVAVSGMSGDLRDRYISIFSSDASNSATATHRINGVWRDFSVGMTSPVFGHGLGTSGEANFNYNGRLVISHNIYAEVFQEVGVVGLVFFLLFIVAIFKELINNYKLKEYLSDYGKILNESLLVFAVMNLFFGLASYGLSSYEWYLLAGLTVVSTNIQIKLA